MLDIANSIERIQFRHFFYTYQSNLNMRLFKENVRKDIHSRIVPFYYRNKFA